jgi:hypothetical protein
MTPATHSITSLARASSIGEILMPIDLAALRLMISSNLSGTWTGRSAVFVPRRIRGAAVLIHQINPVDR